jgi:hypothetical protein
MSKHFPEPEFPPVITLNGPNYIWRSALEDYKARLTRHALGSRSPLPPPSSTESDILVPFKVVSDELGVGRRTIGRRLKDSQNAAVDAA